MFWALALLLVATPCSGVPADNRVAAREADDFDALTYLENTGYLDTPGGRNRHHAPDNVKQALREFQYMAALPITGRLDSRTVDTMKLPRCGDADVIKPSQRPANTQEESEGIAAYKLWETSWNKRNLTYKIESYTQDLTREEIYETLRDALQQWSDVTNLDFTPAEGQTDIRFAFEKGKHPQDNTAFDGPSGVLAHAMYPGYWGAGNVHFDDDEHWTTGNEWYGSNLLEISMHEIGHALGLNHSPNEDSVMYAFYTHRDKLRLHWDDINGIIAKYGGRDTPSRPIGLYIPEQTHTPPRQTNPPPRQTFPLPRQTFPPTQAPPPTNNPNVCAHEVTAMAQVERVQYIFTNDVLFNGRQPMGSIGNTFQGAPTPVRAAVYDRVEKKLYIFSRTKYACYKAAGDGMVPCDNAHIKTLPMTFYNIDAAFQDRDDNMYLLQGDAYTSWYPGMKQLAPNYPKKTSFLFSDVPSRVDAALLDHRGKVWLFSNRYFYRYVYQNGAWALEENSTYFCFN